MSITTKATVSAFALAFALGGASSALAKAHDQGVADGEPTPDNTGGFVQGLEGPGLSGVVSGGAQGDAASSAQGGNGVDPDGAPGQNR